MGRCLIKGGHFPKTQRGKMNKHENILYVSGRKCLSLLNVLKLEFPGPDGLVMRPQKVSVIVRGPLKLHQQGWDDLIPQGFLTDSGPEGLETWAGCRDLSCHGYLWPSARPRAALDNFSKVQLTQGKRLPPALGISARPVDTLRNKCESSQCHH